MKLTLLAWAALLLSTTFCTPAPTQLETVENYYQAFNQANFDKVNQVIADTFTILDDGGNYRMDYSREAYRIYFQWDSVFQPYYQITEVVQADSQITVIVATSSKRFSFLEHSPFIVTEQFRFKDGKIASKEALKYHNFDLEKWTSIRHTLVKYTQNNHPELDGFIYDITPRGAANYLEAIKKYNNALSP